ncbi:MAG: hypothetical protein AAGL34_09920 [Bacteroidota bacterium]
MRCSKLLLLMLFLCTAIASAQRVITFRLNVQEIPSFSQDNVLSIGLRGNIAPLTWVLDTPLNPSKEPGIYEVSVPFETGKPSELYFKFVLNQVEWEGGDARFLKLSEVEQESKPYHFRYVKPMENPFESYVGEWTLKDDLWFSGETESKIDTLYLPNHHTICTVNNTPSSLQWGVEAPSARGHALWTYNPSTEKVVMQSSFYPHRIGLGEGTVDARGNVFLTMRFTGNEPQGTYRKYSYVWLNEDTYELKSYQYDSNNQPTGNFYGGIFTRIKQEN